MDSCYDMVSLAEELSVALKLEFQSMDDENLGKHVIECLCDSDRAGHKGTRKSTTSTLIVVDGVPCLSYSRTQKTIALSSCESEVYAATSGGAEGEFLKSVYDF